METYIGEKPNAAREVNLGERVVLGLLEGIDAAGRSVTCDNFFTSLSLARKLLAKNITVVGTIRKNKPELPRKWSALRKESNSQQFLGSSRTA